MKVRHYVLLLTLPVVLSGCNTFTVSTNYCPKTVDTPGTSCHTISVSTVTDRRCLALGSAEIGQLNPDDSIMPSIFYAPHPLPYVLRTDVSDSLSRNGYRVSEVHADRILTATIVNTELVQYGRDVDKKGLFYKISVDFTLTDPKTDRVVWHQTIDGESSTSFYWNANGVTMAFQSAMDDLVSQLEHSPSFNRAVCYKALGGYG